MNLRYFIFLFFISYCASAQESILQDQQTLQNIELGIDCIYNFQFEHIEETQNYLSQNYSDNPLPQLFYALTIYWKYFPITPTSKYNDPYVENINTSIEKSQRLLEENDDNPEAIFLNLMARLLIMQYYADNHESSKVIPHIRNAYKMVKKGFDLSHEITDFNFSTGLYNYYRDAYPEKHPVYKPFAYFFKDGNKKLGLKQLEYNWKHGIFLDAESLSFLVYISLNFEGNYKKSARYTRELYKAYPNNPLYLSYRIRTLLLLTKYHKAEQLIDELNKISADNQFFQMMVNIYKGILTEKKYHDYQKAKKYYLKAVQLGKAYKPFADDRISYAYYGLSRIYKKSNPSKSEEYRKIAKDLSSYKHLTFD